MVHCALRLTSNHTKRLEAMKALLRRAFALGVSKIPKGIMTDPAFFELYQSKGWHVVPNHFYDPIPDTSQLPHSLWEKPSEMVGVDINIEAQAEFLESVAASHLREFHAITDQPSQNPIEYTRAASFTGVDAGILYSMIREHKPKKIIEIGSGGSTLLSLRMIHFLFGTKMWWLGRGSRT